ncbi:unnamed protein product, partial [Rotaria sp. Silwood1]
MYPSHHPMQSNDVGIPPKQQQQLTDEQPFVSTTPARHSQGVKRRSISASPPRLINNNLPSISKILNNNSVKNTPLDINGEPNTRISNMESPLINMIQM